MHAHLCGQLFKQLTAFPLFYSPSAFPSHLISSNAGTSSVSYIQQLSGNFVKAKWHRNHENETGHLVFLGVDKLRWTDRKHLSHRASQWLVLKLWIISQVKMFALLFLVPILPLLLTSRLAFGAKCGVVPSDLIDCARKHGIDRIPSDSEGYGFGFGSIDAVENMCR